MYEYFLEHSVNTKKIKTVDDNFISLYENRYPDDLLTLWKETGIGVFGDGLFRIINPDDYQELVDNSYINIQDESVLPFMTTAFGDIFAYVKNKELDDYIIFANFRYGIFKVLTEDIDYLMNDLVWDEEVLELWFNLDQYIDVKAKLGVPDFDECYGYIPYLVMGGKEDIDHIQIVKVLPYIDIITQSIGKLEFSK